MRGLGIGLVVVGIIFGIFAFSMDTSVMTPPQTILGVGIPGQRVANLSLMNEQRNLLLVAGLFSVVGVVLIVGTGMAQPGVQPETAKSPWDIRKCPFCAEDIKREATVCRFCGLELSDEPPPDLDRLQALYAEAQAAYQCWAAVASEDSFDLRDRLVPLRHEFIERFQRVVVGCGGQDARLRSATAMKAARDFPGLLDDPDFSAALEELA